MSKIDISSTAIEKGIDVAKEFLGKLVIPAIEETGLLLRDRVTFWRFKNQVKMINGARDICIKNGITPKNIPIKFLSPILEFSGLEDDEVLREKWATLLSNMVDSDQNIENHVFPHLLSQLSLNEFELIEQSVDSKIRERQELKAQLEEINTQYPSLKEQLEELDLKINSNPWNEGYSTNPLIKERRILEGKINDINNLTSKVKQPPEIEMKDLKEFELANLIRLGIVKTISNQYAYVESNTFPLDRYDESVNLENLEIAIEQDYEEHLITQLGELFIEVCTEKNKKKK